VTDNDTPEEGVRSEKTEGGLREREEKPEERRQKAGRMQKAEELGDELSPGMRIGTRLGVYDSYLEVGQGGG